MSTWEPRRGLWAVCACCGKGFFITSPREWTYRKQISISGAKRTIYYHTWSCYRKHKEVLKEMNLKLPKKKPRKNAAKLPVDIEGKT